ncbi:hypothetical protein [Sporisorium scitamineum]|uniref:Uncharacterized protein n=1 Tax=Sporisorium scitamineum TaxID=49012 RepID=A0A0F7S7Y3_9BASI|nr:hypothetical protein [Sporisorium scitamineum]
MLSPPQFADVQLRDPLSPVTASRRSLAGSSPSQPNTPSGPDVADWSFISTYLNSYPDNVSTWPGSPLARSRPGSGSVSRDSTIRSPLAQSYVWSTLPRRSSQDDDGEPRSYTAATVRPGSGLLEPIFEGDATDPSTSLGDTSAFVFDRYHFSSTSTRPEPSCTGPRSSSTPLMHSEVAAGRISRTSSRHTDASGEGSTARFTPKQLLLAVPLLQLEVARSNRVPEPDSDGLETPSSPLSSCRAYLTPTASFSDGASPTPREAPRPSTLAVIDDGAAEPDPSHDDRDPQMSSALLAETSSARGHCHVSLNSSHSKPVPAEIRICWPTNLSAASVEEVNSPSRYGLTRSPTSRTSHWQPSRTDSTALTTPQKSQAATEADADRHLRADSLSPPRSATSAASAETQSSETVELVPWQVATTDSAGTRRSEEIFRPLSMTQSMSRSGLGSSRDTVMSKAIARTTATDSRRSTLQTPQLKGGSDFLWGRMEAEDRHSLGQGRPSADLSQLRSVETGFDCARKVAGTAIGRLACEQTEARPSYRQAGLDEAEHSRSSSGGYTIASPPGGVDRLLFELKQGSIDSRHRKNTYYHDHGGPAYVHRRSSTLNNITIGPRSSSIRRRHQSVDVEAQQRRRFVADPGIAIGLTSVAEQPAERCSEPTAASLSGHDPMIAGYADAARRPKRNVANSDAFQNAAARAHGSTTLHSPSLAMFLSAFIVFYQVFFFTFEASYLWSAISPALPLVGAALFLVLNVLVLQINLLPSLRTSLLPWSTTLLVLVMAYCSSLSALMIARLAQSPDRGASAPGIHFHRARSSKGSALREVLRDLPFPAILFVLGIVGLVAGIVLTARLLLNRRQRQD